MKISMALFIRSTIFIYLFVNKLAKLNLLTNVHRLFISDQWIATQETEKFNLVHPCWELPLFMLHKFRQLEILNSKDIWIKAFVAAAAENGVETCCFPNVPAVQMSLLSRWRSPRGVNMLLILQMFCRIYCQIDADAGLLLNISWVSIAQCNLLQPHPTAEFVALIVQKFCQYFAAKKARSFIFSLFESSLCISAAAALSPCLQLITMVTTLYKNCSNFFLIFWQLLTCRSSKQVAQQKQSVEAVPRKEKMCPCLCWGNFTVTNI